MTRLPHGTRIAEAGLTLIVALIYLATVRQDETWFGGDFALYLMHALNIVHGHRYSDTLFIYNPANNIISPSAYPPVFPLILAPLVALFGISLGPLKILMSLISGGFVLASGRLFRLSGRGPIQSLMLMAATALSPAIFLRHDLVLSDVSFALLCLLVVNLVLATAPNQGRLEGWRLFLTGLLTLLAMQTRTIGVVLPLALIVYAILHLGGHKRGLILVGVAAIVLSWLVSKAVHADAATYGSYFTLYQQGGAGEFLILSARTYGQMLAEVLGLSLGHEANRVLGAIALILIAAALAARLSRSMRNRQWPGLIEIFAVGYCVTVFLFPLRFEVVRYNMPLVPFLLLFIAEGIETLLRMALPKMGNDAAVVSCALASFFLICLLPFYAGYRPVPVMAYAVTAGDSRELFSFLKQALPEDTVILARNPRVVACFGQRRASNWPSNPTFERLFAWQRRIGAGYLLVESSLQTDDSPRIAAILSAAPDRFEGVFQNSSFSLFRIRDSLESR